eukprot:jgi/Bigna1/140976/aug1.59_g15684
MVGYAITARKRWIPHLRFFKDQLSEFLVHRNTQIISHVNKAEPMISIQEGGDTCKMTKVEEVTLRQLRKDPQREVVTSSIPTPKDLSTSVQGYLREQNIDNNNNNYANKDGSDDRHTRLTLYTGYRATIVLTNAGPSLMIDTMKKIVQPTTVRDVIMQRTEEVRDRMAGRNATREEEIEEIERVCHNAVQNRGVMTEYNNYLYRAIRINWRLNPMRSEFKKGDTTVTFYDYVRERYGREFAKRVRDEDGMLEVERGSRSRRRRADDNNEENKESKKIYLVPSLCYMTGLPDNIQDIHQVGKEIAAKTKVEASSRMTLITSVLQNLQDKHGDGKEYFTTKPNELDDVPVLVGSQRESYISSCRQVVVENGRTY